jgi:hypothetical protein
VHEVSRVARHAKWETAERRTARGKQAVEILLMVGEFPVEEWPRDFFFADLELKT